MTTNINVEQCCFMSEGEPVDAFLYQPNGGRKHPAVVLSPSRLRTIEQLDWLARGLAAKGFLVLAHRYREGDTRYQLRDVDDIRSGISFLQSLPSADAQRLAAVGHSRGGSASLRSAAQDVRIRAAVALSPPIDIARYMRALEHYAPARYRAMVAGYGATPAEDPDFYRAISPLTYAATLKAAVLLVHGTADLIAPHQHSQWMHEALLEGGNARCTIELVSGMGHFFEMEMKGYHFDHVACLVGDWLSKVLSM